MNTIIALTVTLMAICVVPSTSDCSAKVSFVWQIRVQLLDERLAAVGLS